MRTVVYFFFIAYSMSLTSQSFICDGTVYLSQNNGSPPTQLVSVGIVDDSVFFNHINTYSGLHLNGIGYNVKDGFIYGTTSSGNIYRLKADGSSIFIGSDSRMSQLSVIAGDVNYDGTYVALDRNRGTINFYSVLNTFEVLKTENLYWSPASGISGPLTKIFSDVVFHPNQPNTLIALQQDFLGPFQSRGFIMSIDADINSPTLGMVKPLFRVDPAVIRASGALFVNSQGEILAYGKNNGVGFQQNKLYRFNLDNRSVELLGTGESSEGQDGCSCPISLELNKVIDSIRVDCDNLTVYYTVSLISQSNYKYMNPIVRDSFSNGGYLDSLFHTPANTLINTTSGNKSIKFIVSELNQGDSLDYKFSVRYPNSSLPISNQAELIGVWEESSSKIVSDDPETPEYKDSTTLTREMLESIKRPITTISESFNICEGDTLAVYGLSVSNQGVYLDTTRGAFCDTVHRIEVSFNDAFLKRDTLQICHGDSVFFIDKWIHHEGFYERNYQTDLGCDSIISLQLEVDSLINADIAEYLCPNTSIHIKDLVIDSVGQYFTTTDGPNCDTLWNITVSTPPGIQPEVDLEKACPGSPTGKLELLKNSVLSFDTFYWSTGGSSFIIDSLREGRYSLNIIDTFGCLTSHEFIIEEEVSPELDVDIQKADCHNDFLGLVIIASSDSTSRFSFNNGPATKTNRYESPGGSKVHIVNHFNGCVQDTSVVVPRVDTIDPALNIRFSGECGSIATLSVDFNSSDTGAIENVTFSGLDSIYSNQNNQIITLKAYQSGKVTAIVQDTHGCIYRRDAQLEVIDDYRIWVPNAFTPNGDNINDVFHIYASECVDRIEKFQVFDRWGELVFEALDFLPEEKGWNGQLNNEVMDTGVYTYRVLFTNKSGGSDEITGSVTLLK